MQEDPRQRYTRNYDGNLAYDLEMPERLPEYTIPEPEIIETPVAAPVPRQRQGIAPGAMLGTLCACSLLVMMIMSHIRLAVLSNDVVLLENQISTLKTDQTRLKIVHESVFNLTEVEEYAVNILGMQKPREGQMFYIDNTAPDRAVIHRNPNSSGGLGAFFAALKALFS